MAARINFDTADTPQFSTECPVRRSPQGCTPVYFGEATGIAARRLQLAHPEFELGRRHLGAKRPSCEKKRP